VVLQDVQQAHADISKKDSHLPSRNYYPYRISSPHSATASLLIVWHAARLIHLLLDSSHIGSGRNTIEADRVYNHLLAKQGSSKLL